MCQLAYITYVQHFDAMLWSLHILSGNGVQYVNFDAEYSDIVVGGG